MAVIPGFEADGILPAGDYELSFDELRHSIVVVGVGGEFPSAFQQSRRDGKPRGIVKIRYGGQS